MNKTSSPEANNTSLLHRFFELIGIYQAPDTTEDLEQEIQEILEDGEEQGLISSQEGEMISTIFEFRETVAKEIMTPRTEMICASASTTVEEMISIISEHGFTRIPIFSEKPDNIIGILHAKDLLYHCSCSELPTDAGNIAKQAPIFALEKDKII